MKITFSTPISPLESCSCSATLAAVPIRLVVSIQMLHHRTVPPPPQRNHPPPFSIFLYICTHPAAAMATVYMYQNGMNITWDWYSSSTQWEQQQQKKNRTKRGGGGGEGGGRAEQLLIRVAQIFICLKGQSITRWHNIDIIITELELI